MTTDRTAAPVRPPAHERPAPADRIPPAGGFAVLLGGAHAASLRPAARAASRPRKRAEQRGPGNEPQPPAARRADARHADSTPPPAATQPDAPVPYVLTVATPPVPAPAPIAVTVAPVEPAPAPATASPARGGAVAASARGIAPATRAAAPAGPAEPPATAAALALPAEPPATAAALALPAVPAAPAQPAAVLAGAATPQPFAGHAQPAILPPAAPATPAAVAPPVLTQRAAPLHHVPRVVGTLLRVAHEKGITHAKISLRPDDLGSIEVRLHASPAGISAHVVADSPEAARLLTQAGYDLRRTLAFRDVNLLSLEVSTTGDRRRRDERPGQTSHPDAPAGAARISGGDDSPSPSAPVSVLELPGGLLVDVFA